MPTTFDTAQLIYMYVPGISNSTLKNATNGCNKRKGNIIAQNNHLEKYLDLECVAKQHQTLCELKYSFGSISNRPLPRGLAQ